jgi:hypothetical protein
MFLLWALGLSLSGAVCFFSGERLVPDEADLASPELQRIEALPSQHVTGAEQDCGAYQD